MSMHRGMITRVESGVYTGTAFQHTDASPTRIPVSSSGRKYVRRISKSHRRQRLELKVMVPFARPAVKLIRLFAFKHAI